MIHLILFVFLSVLFIVVHVNCITLFCFSVFVLRMAMVPDCLAYWTLYVSQTKLILMWQKTTRSTYQCKLISTSSIKHTKYKQRNIPGRSNSLCQHHFKWDAEANSKVQRHVPSCYLFLSFCFLRAVFDMWTVCSFLSHVAHWSDLSVLEPALLSLSC